MEKEVAIIHTDLTLKGGGERVCVSLIEALNKRGVIPEVYTYRPVNETNFGAYYGKNISFKLHSIFPFDITKFGMYIPLVAGIHSSLLTHFGAIINTGIFVPLSFRFLVKKYLCYVYNPIQFFYTPEKYRKNILWRLYLAPQQAFMVNRIPMINDGELLAVSNFTKMRIKKYWGKESTTIYPPVDLEKFHEANTNKVRDGVISIGRFELHKNHKMQLEIAKKLPNMTFRLCGSANTPSSKSMLQEIIIKSEEMGLSNVEFYPNLSFNKLIKLLSESKFFLHTMVNEDFGLTPCEAISAGCIPLVHNSGGSIEVVPIRELRYNDCQEGAARLKYMAQNDLQSQLVDLQNYVRCNFSEAFFQKEMIKSIGLYN